MPQRTLLIGWRLFFGLLTLVAIVTQLVIHLQHRFDVVNYFSYFTNLSNLFATVVFLVGAVYLLQRRELTLAEDLIRGALVVAITIVGIVWFALLRDEDLGALLPWVNIVLHVIMPVAVVADWLYAPPKPHMTMWKARYWLIYPLVYVVYSLIRGAITGFYPYPFFNPAKSGGYGGVALYCIAIFVAFLLVSWLLITLANLLKGRKSSAQGA